MNSVIAQTENKKGYKQVIPVQRLPDTYKRHMMYCAYEEIMRDYCNDLRKRVIGAIITHYTSISEISVQH